MRGLLMLAGILVLQEAAISERQYSGDVVAHTVSAGESLVSLGARSGVEPRTLAADNGLNVGTVLKVGQPLVIDNRHVIPQHPVDGIVINVPQRMLFVFVDSRRCRRGVAAFRRTCLQARTIRWAIAGSACPTLPSGSMARFNRPVSIASRPMGASGCIQMMRGPCLKWYGSECQSKSSTNPFWSRASTRST